MYARLAIGTVVCQCKNYPHHNDGYSISSVFQTSLSIFLLQAEMDEEIDDLDDNTDEKEENLEDW